MKLSIEELTSNINVVKKKIKQDTYYFGLTEFIIDVIAESKLDKSFHYDYSKLINRINITLREISVFRDDIKRDLLDFFYKLLTNKHGILPKIRAEYRYEELEQLELMEKKIKNRFTSFIKNRRLIEQVTNNKLLTIKDDLNKINKSED